MNVDVTTSIEVNRPIHVVAAFASDPDRAREWYRNIKAVEWKTDKPLRVGSQIAFVAAFLGRKLAYTYEVVEHVPGERFVMRTSEGPFPMETIYTWRTTPAGTLMHLRNRGVPKGFSRLMAPVMKTAMRRANRNDLQALKAVLEIRAERNSAG